MGLIGFGDRADLATFAGRIAARDEIDARMAEWCGARPLAEVPDAFESAAAAAAPVYPMPDLATHPHHQPRASLLDVARVPMQALLAPLSAPPPPLPPPPPPPP